MERQALMGKLTIIFRSVFNDNTLVVTDDLTASDVNDWDSLTHMILISEVEKVFSITFKLKELKRMKNVGDMVDIILSKL